MKILDVMLRLSAPDTRIMPSAPPVGVARAQIVPSWFEVSCSGKPTSWSGDLGLGLFISDLFHKHKIDGGYEAEECSCVVPVQTFVLEHQVGEDGEDYERYTLLYHLQLHQREGTSVANETDAVGRHLTAVFKESYEPRKGDDEQQRPVGRYTVGLQLQVSIPGEGHEDIAQDEQGYGVKSVHHILSKTSFMRSEIELLYSVFIFVV